MIEVKEYKKSFGARNLLSDVNLTIEEGKIYGLVGESGSGKSTFLRNIAMLDVDYEGTILIDGQDITKIKKRNREKFRTSKFSYVFSDPYLLNYLSLRDNTALTQTLTGEPIDEKKLDELILKLSLSQVVNSHVEDLSAGEKQRVSIVRALLADKKYLICDEPTAHVDPENALKILEIFRSIAHDMGKAVIIALHDYSNLNLFDRILKVEKRTIK